MTYVPTLAPNPNPTLVPNLNKSLYYNIGLIIISSIFFCSLFGVYYKNSIYKPL